MSPILSHSVDESWSLIRHKRECWSRVDGLAGTRGKSRCA